MEAITRAEFNDNKSQLASTMQEAIKESLQDLKVDLLDALEKKVAKSHSLIVTDTVTLRDLKEAKVEILATTRRNLSEAVADLGNRMDVQHGITHAKLDELSKHVHMVLGEHEDRLKDQETSS